MKVVVDTNVLIAGLVAEGLCRDIVKRRLPGCELFTSRALLQELAEKLREKFGVNPKELPLLQIYEDSATVVKPARLPKPVCRDADDDEALATALAAHAGIILTGDNDLLTLKEFQGIRILSPRLFVEWLDQNPSP
ncbi:MAG: putative toxin-antitoxin system toxin component, PIN family [Verrucomicrobia bacterium]|nr:putative toxin-antitoxin system toxin component, PIN family [Verrucomicrobiota bacterium]